MQAKQVINAHMNINVTFLLNYKLARMNTKKEQKRKKKNIKIVFKTNEM